MHELLQDLTSAGRRLRNTWGFSAMAVLMLSLGVGATTAVFRLVDVLAPRSAPYLNCDTMAAFSSDPSIVRVDELPDRMALEDFISDAYVASHEAPDGERGAFQEAAGAILERPFLVLLGVAVLAFLVACTDSSRALLARREAKRGDAGVSRTSAATHEEILRQRSAEGAVPMILGLVGALSFAAVALRALTTFASADLLAPMPRLGLDGRAIAFALCVFALAEARRRNSRTGLNS